MKKTSKSLKTICTASIVLGATSLADITPADATEVLSYQSLGNGAAVRASLLNEITPNNVYASSKDEEAKCGEGKCGGEEASDDAKHDGEAKCGEGKCGGEEASDDAKHDGEAKCGEGKCGGE